MTTITAPSIIMQLIWGCKYIRPIITTTGSIYIRSPHKLLALSRYFGWESTYETRNTTVTFATSDGWKERVPAPSHLFALFLVIPTSNTRISTPTVPMYKGIVSFASFL